MTDKASRTILKARGLSKHFNGFAALSGVDIEVERHAIHALIGPNGAGKTTLFNLLTRFLAPSAGTITFKGEDITFMGAADVARRGLVRSFQISAVFPNLSVLDNVRIPIQRKESNSFSFWRSDRTLDVFNDQAMDLLEKVGLAQFANRPAVDLSYGRKRALEIATTLSLDPEMLLLDEPMAGLGPEDIERISALIRAIAPGRTILMVEHNLSVVESLSNRITVLARGTVLAEGPYRSVARDPRVIEAYVGSVGHA